MSDVLCFVEATPVNATHFMITWKEYTELKVSVKGKPMAFVRGD